MIPDEQLVPICIRVAKSVAKGMDGEDVDVDELVNIGYAATKKLNDVPFACVVASFRMRDFLQPPEKNRKDFSGKSRNDARQGAGKGEAPSPVEGIIATEELRRLREFVEELEEEEKEILKLKYRDGLTFPEIGRIYQKSRTWAFLKHKGILERLKLRMKGDDQ